MPILTLKTDEKLIEIPFSGKPILSSVLESAGVYISAPCGGNGKCGKCAVNVFGEISLPTEKEKRLNKRLGCQTVLLGNATVILPETYGKNADIETNIGEIYANRTEINYGAVVDLGTTTLAVKLFSGSGEFLADVVALNPQGAIASDVIGRIDASLKGKTEFLKECVLKVINQMLAEACKKANISLSQIDKTVITGNTVMLYLLCGLNPKSIAVAPFKADNLFGIDISYPISAYLPPCINAFVGADLVCSVIASGMCQKDETSLLCDIGTNGEIALWKDKKLFVTSAAAGPAFEGAEISCGCQGISGAIDKVWADKGSVKIHTIDDETPIGLCGSGLLDAVATFLDLGYIDKSGAIDSPLKLPVTEKEISINNQDIRSLQLAKSAIASAIEVLLEETETDINEINKFYLSGGFGNRLNVASAVRVGLIPESLKDKAVLIGNGALMGGGMMLLNSDAKKTACEIVKQTTHIALGGNPRFNQLFLENINFH